MTKPKKPKESKREERKSTALSGVKKPLGLTMPDVNNKKVLGKLNGMKVLTPFVVASHFNIRLSLAKSFLKELEKRKIIEYVSGGKNVKIYRMLA